MSSMNSTKWIVINGVAPIITHVKAWNNNHEYRFIIKGATVIINKCYRFYREWTIWRCPEKYPPPSTWLEQEHNNKVNFFFFYILRVAVETNGFSLLLHPSCTHWFDQCNVMTLYYCMCNTTYLKVYIYSACKHTQTSVNGITIVLGFCWPEAILPRGGNRVQALTITFSGDLSREPQNRKLAACKHRRKLDSFHQRQRVNVHIDRFGSSIKAGTVQ